MIWITDNTTLVFDTITTMFCLSIVFISQHVSALVSHRQMICLQRLTCTELLLSRVCGDYIRRVLDWQLDLLDQHTVTHNYSVLHFTTHNNWVSSLALKTPAPTAATKSYGIPCHYSLAGCLNQPTAVPVAALVYNPGTHHKENTS
jgi:hypothetical protein